jgi:type IV pilus assembly protein PilY1
MMHRRHERRALVMLIALLGLLLVPVSASPKKTTSSPPVDPSGDDLFLLTASTSPNVVIIMDNSKSMNHIEWHPKFDPNAASYGCSDFNNSQVYPYSIDTNETHCTNTRKIYGPETDTLWDGRYLNWYFSDDADAYENEIQTAKANVEGCTQAGGAKFFDDKYRRTRLEASKQVLLDLLCVAEPKNVRFALAWYRDPEDAPLNDPNGGYLKEDLGRSNPNHAAELETKIKGTGLNSSTEEATPLSESLFQIYTYWMSRDVANVPTGRDGVTKFPIYHYDKFGNFESNPGQYFEDTLLHECEKAFVVIVTDGLPTRDDFDVEVTTDETAGFSDFDALIGDYHDEGDDGVADAERPGAANEPSYFLDDIAKYMYDHDFRPDLGGDQTIDTYTIGLATDQATDDFLGMTAEVGNGLFFHTQDGDQLQYALIAALNDIIEKAASFTAAAVPSARTVDGGDFYQSYFFPSGRSAFWEGHIRAWHITATGDIIDANGNCALIDADAGECNSGPFKPEAVFYWDAAEEMPQPGSRTLYASKLVAGDSTRVAFDTSLTPADLDVAVFAAPPDPTPNSVLFPVMGSTALNEEGLADEVVQFVRGCFFGTGVPANVLVPEACLARPARLGDIFHSNPVVVRQPNSPLFEPSYRAFKTAYAGRTRVIYAGTNAGFLEAIEAGTWQAGATPPGYDAGTGAELFGFMPWESRLSIENLPIDSATDRGHYVDGSPQVADVWIYPDGASTGTTAANGSANGSEWRTMLVGGLRRGGRHYYALDITNPDGIAGPGGTNLAYPGFQASGPAYGWEFPKEGDPGGYLPLMGHSWAQPIITRVKVGVDNDGVGHERWVAVFTGGYDENGDPNPQEVSGSVSVYDVTATQGRAIFMIDMKTGQVLARKKLDAGASDAQQWMRFAMLSTPAIFDLNNDGFADVIYVGNLGGTMFKWVVKPLGGDPVNGSHASDDADQPNWPFKAFFQAPVANDSGTLYFQNFFFPPAGAMMDGKLWLGFGAGERKDLPYVGNAAIDENNRFYVVNDPDPLELTGLGTVTEGDLIDATNSPSGVTLSTERGFFIKGGEGEKFVTSTVIFAGKVITASFVPTPSADPCAARGEATAYVFDVLTGEGYFQDTSNNPMRTMDIGVGLPTDPKVSVGPGGKDNRVYIEKSGADLESIGQDDVPAGGQLLYWRERP